MSLVERVFVIKVQFFPSTVFSTFVVSNLVSFLFFVDRNSEGPPQLPHYAWENLHRLPVQTSGIPIEVSSLLGVTIWELSQHNSRKFLPLDLAKVQEQWC